MFIPVHFCEENKTEKKETGVNLSQSLGKYWHYLSMNVVGVEGNKKGRIGMEVIKRRVYHQNKDTDVWRRGKVYRRPRQRRAVWREFTINRACKEIKKGEAKHLQLLKSLKKTLMNCLLFWLLHLQRAQKYHHRAEWAARTSGWSETLSSEWLLTAATCTPDLDCTSASRSDGDNSS